jgi:MFS family permease
VLLVTIWELGEAAGPLLIAPLSEMFGRYPVINACNVLFIAATALAALSQTTGVFIAARCLTGLAVATNVLGPAIVGDIFAPEQRGTAMSLIMIAPLIGGAIGPAIAGAVSQTLGWRQVVWMSVLLAGCCEVLFLFFFRETYKVVILRRQVEKTRSSTDIDGIKTELDIHEEATPSLLVSLLRPAEVLFSSIVLMGISLVGAVVYSYFYVMSTSLPDILEEIYGLSPAQSGGAFMFFSKSSPADGRNLD